MLRKATCFTQSTKGNVNLIYKHPDRHTLDNFWPNVWAQHGLVNLTYKINHHTLNSSYQYALALLINELNTLKVDLRSF